MWVSVFDDYEVTPPQLTSTVLSVFYGYEVTPPQLTSTVPSVFDDYEVTPPQLTSTVLSVLETSGPPPKVLMVSETEQLPPLASVEIPGPFYF